jgi:hypothetical protein
MAPAICDGDTVRVKICTNGTLIQAGPKNSTRPGDIIVYCAAAAVSVPEYMWMCGRAVNKYRKDGEWRFKTQIDSSSELDPWEVPEHYLLGVVDGVVHGANPQDYRSTSTRPSYDDGQGLDIPTLVFYLLTGIVIGAVGGVFMAKAYVTRKRADQTGFYNGKPS